MKLNVDFSEHDSEMAVQIEESCEAIEPLFREVQTITKYVGGEQYTGEYIVTPKVTEQIMPTKEKVLLDDMTIKPIPFFNVGNTSGGSTVYIGSEV